MVLTLLLLFLLAVLLLLLLLHIHIKYAYLYVTAYNVDSIIAKTQACTILRVDMQNLVQTL